MKDLNPGTVARTIALALALFNQAMTMSGHKIIDVADDDIYQAVSLIFTIAASLAAWWKNNSFTAAAKEADKYLSDLKSEVK